MYSRCSMLPKAQKTLKELPTCNVVSWNVLITGYVQQGKDHEALSCFRNMKTEGIAPDAVTFTCILKTCGKIGAIDKGKELHDEIVSRGLLKKDIVLGTALVDMYVKCGELQKAHIVLEELYMRNIVSWSALIAGYVQQGQGHEALNCFEQLQNEGLSPDVVTFTFALKACGNIRAIDKGMHIHKEIVKKGLEDLMLNTSLVDMYAKCGSFDRAKEVLKRLPVRDVVSWNSLIARYVQQGNGCEALDCFKKMKSEGLSPDGVTFICILKACGSIGDVGKGMQIHDEIVATRLLKKDIVLGTALVDMYAKCGLLARAHDVLNIFDVRNIMIWSALVSGYVQQGKGYEALECLKQMQSEGFLADVVTFICALKACGSTETIEKGKQFHNEILCGDFLSTDVAIGNALVDMYAKCGMLAQSQKVLEELPVRSVVSWNALISGYAQQGQGREALNCFERMQSEGFHPDDVTCLCVLSACCHSGLLDDAQMLFRNMTKNYGIVPNIEHHTCMVVIFGFSGLFDKAMQVIKAMPSSDYPAVWLALLGGCKKWGNVKLGKLAFDQALQLDDTCAVIYVLMADIFATAGMQKDAEKIDMMRLKNAKCKDPGSNLWIDASANDISFPACY